MNSFTLKWIAIITMVIDHTGLVLFPADMRFRMVGRIAFPIFCFLISEGFSHTKDIKKYISRMLIFGVISEVPFDLTFHKAYVDWGSQNIFWTLSLSLILLYVLRYTDFWGARIVLVMVFYLAAEALHVDYGGKGVMLPVIYHEFKENKALRVSLGAAWCFLYSGIQRYALAASGFLIFYNGKKGPGMKYLFYVFYPAHLMVLYMISRSGIML